jgi:hypothetical protein
MKYKYNCIAILALANRKLGNLSGKIKSYKILTLLYSLYDYDLLKAKKADG